MIDVKEMVGKPQTIKEVNSAMLERLIYERGPLSKPQLAKLTGLSLPTVNKLVDDLYDQQCVRQVGVTGSRAGRKAKLYEIDRSTGCLVALYYRWGKFICRIADISGRIIAASAYPLFTDDQNSATESTLSAIDDMIKKAPAQVKSIGVGVPGAVLSNGLISGIPKIEVWEGFNLTELLKSRYSADIWVENDVKLAAVGYYHANLEKEYDHLVYIYVGNGMGSGIIINRKLLRGANNFAGELGFMAPLDGKKADKPYTAHGGYLESQMRQFINYEREEFESSIPPEQRQRLVNFLASAAANYAAVLNPNAIVLGGEAFGGASGELIEEIKHRMTLYTAAGSMPEIVRDDSPDTGIDGLVSTCRIGLNPRTQLVQDGGV